MLDVELNLKTKISEALKQMGIDVDLDFIVIERSKNKEHGDYASNVVLKCASKAKKNPHDLAIELVSIISKDGIEKIEIAGPGFINFFIKKDVLTALVKKIISEENHFGDGEKKNKSINVEFVSANPTGDLHLGHARGAAIGDSIARILEKNGYDVTREYYVNDAGQQITHLGESLMSRYFALFGKELPMPKDGYYGEDVKDIALQIKNRDGGAHLSESKETLKFFCNEGIELELQKIIKDLDMYRVHFDIFSHERDIRKNNRVEKLIESLKNYTYTQDGALLLQTSKFLDDKDRVIVKSNGDYTYMLPDIAYHLDKLSRGYDLLIDVLGADHHGYINRMKSSLMMFDYKPDVLEIELIQMVRMMRDGKEVKLSKRAGDADTLRDLCEEVGVDAARFFFVERAASSHLDFDLSLAISKSSSNPVYYAQYAHARLCSLLLSAKEIPLDYEGKNLGMPSEIALLKCLNDYSTTIAQAANERAPYKITTYILKLAQLTHVFYTECRVIDIDHIEVTSSRLALVKSCQIVLKNALALIGVSAPEKM